MRGRVLVVIALAMGVGGSTVLHSQNGGDSDLDKQVLDDWQKRRKAMKGVRYKIEGVEVYAKGSMTDTDNTPGAHPSVRKNFPSKDLSFPKQMAYAIDFSRGRIRKEF